MNTIDLLVDSELTELATQEAERFVHKYCRPWIGEQAVWPISRAQIHGLLQIAKNEPELLAPFAEHQAKKLKDQDDKSRVAQEFWKLVQKIASPSRKGPDWPLAEIYQKSLPADLCAPETGEPSRQESPQEKKSREEKRRVWEKEWKREVYPAFFQIFCIHYLYLMSKSPNNREQSANGGPFKKKPR